MGIWAHAQFAASAMENWHESTKLSNGLEMPTVALGTWKSKAGETKAAVEHALRVGYKHIDCSPLYGNQKEVGEAWRAVREDGTIRRRAQVFFTSKIFPKYKAEEFEADVLKTLEELGLEYLDLCLIHWPLIEHASLADMWAAMEALVEKGLVKSIGVSNFSVVKLQHILDVAKVKPAVNQVELHPQWSQPALRTFCAENGVYVQAYCPLGSPDQFSPGGLNRKCTGTVPLFDDRVRAIAERVGKTSAQVLLRWGIQSGHCVVPKSVTPKYIEENLLISDWELSNEDMQLLNNWSPQYRLLHGAFHTGPQRAYKTLMELWDEDTSYLEGRDFETPEGFKLK